MTGEKRENAIREVENLRLMDVSLNFFFNLQMTLCYEADLREV